MSYIDITGQKFGRWTVLEYAGSKNELSLWKCRCECGTIKTLYRTTLVTGSSKSCGCYCREVKSQLHSQLGARSRLHASWQAMKQRCYNENCCSYYNYGARGISVCDEWRNSYNAFEDWALSNGYDDNLQIDRIDGTGNYEPSNCRWVTAHDNNLNKRTNVRINYNGVLLNTYEASEISGIPIKLIHQRKSRGWSDERIMNTPINVKEVTIEYKGKTYTNKEFAKEIGIDNYTLRERLRDGWTIERIANTPKKNKPKFEYEGKNYSLKEFAKFLDMPTYVVELRYNRGWSTDDIAKTPAFKAKTISFNSKEYTIKEFAELVGSTYGAIRKQLVKGRTPEEIYVKYRKED